jgi:HK97 gp10 family phage protein
MVESYKIEGLDALKRSINELTADLKRKVVRAGLRDAAAPIARAARAKAPVMNPWKVIHTQKGPKRVETHPYRLPGTLKNSIITKASKHFNGKNGEIGVYIAVRKRKGLGGKAGARNPFDPFYWRFQEFGTRHHAAQPFMGPAFDANSARAIDIFKARLKVRIDKANKKAST